MWSQVFLPFPSALLPSWWRMHSKFCCCKALTKREVWLRAGTSLARSAAAILPRNRALKQDWETCEATTLPHGDQKWDLYKFPAIQQKWINHGKPYPISCIWARWKFGAPLWRGQPPFSDVLPPRLGPGQTWTWVGLTSFSWFEWDSLIHHEKIWKVRVGKGPKIGTQYIAVWFFQWRVNLEQLYPPSARFRRDNDDMMRIWQLLPLLDGSEFSLPRLQGQSRCHGHEI